MAHYLYRRGDGNEGNFVRALITLTDEQSPYAALSALVANDYIAGKRVRRHIIANIETDGEAEYGISATVYEGPDGEQAFGAAWLTAELQPLSADDVEHYRGQGRIGMQPQTLREALDRAAWRMFAEQNKSFVPPARAFEYFINCDERGEFSADVRNAAGATVWETSGEVFEDGFMSHKGDLEGLRAYLVSLGVMRDEDTLRAGQ